MIRRVAAPVAALAAMMVVAAASTVALASTAAASTSTAGRSAQRYATAAAAIAPVPMGASCVPEAAADVDLGAAWLLVRADDVARAAFERAVDRDPDCALGYWGQALARFAEAAAGSASAVDAVTATTGRAAAVPARTAFERAAIAALIRLRDREAAPGVRAAWPARVTAYRDALCADAATDRGVRLWCARALADTATSLPPAVIVPGTSPAVAALEHVVELARTQPLDVGGAVIVLEVAPDPQAPIVTRALAAIAAANPPAPAPHALAARTAIRRGDWSVAVTEAERARAAGPDDPRAIEARQGQIEALLQLGRRAEAYALAHHALTASDALPEDAARLYARVVLGDRRIDGRGLGDRAALPMGASLAGQWPVVFVAGLDAALRAWPGPDAALVARAREAVTALESLAGDRGAGEVGWAVTIVKAAIAASQDEHQEMALLLTHAADLERESALVRASLPLVPTDEIAAELWLRTYRYEDARRDAHAVLAALPQRISPYVVLARTAVRVKDAGAAADGWRHVLELRSTADPDDTVRLEAQQAIRP